LKNRCFFNFAQQEAIRQQRPWGSILFKILDNFEPRQAQIRPPEKYKQAITRAGRRERRPANILQPYNIDKHAFV